MAEYLPWIFVGMAVGAFIVLMWIVVEAVIARRSRRG